MIKWDLNMRLLLQDQLRQDYTLAWIVDDWRKMSGTKYAALSVSGISKEVKMGLTDEEYKMKRWAMYDPLKVYETLIGRDAIEWIIKNSKGRKNER